METIKINIYKFDELSERAKETARQWWRDGEVESTPFYVDEAHESFKKFAEVFNITDWSIDYFQPYRNEYAIHLDDEHKEMTGIKLYGHLLHNYFNDLFKPKYYGCVERDDYIKHPRIKSKELTNKGRLKNWFNPYYSAITFTNSCVLTGVCYDDSILQPIYDFLNKPSDRIDFEDLIDDCIQSLCSAVQDEYEWRMSDEEVDESIRANEYDFTVDGQIY